MIRRFFCIFLCLGILLSTLPVFAEGADDPAAVRKMTENELREKQAREQEGKNEDTVLSDYSDSSASGYAYIAPGLQ